MVKLTMYVTETQLTRLKRLAQGRHISELIRQAIDEFLARMERNIATERRSD
jgi:hypothetical protein